MSSINETQKKLLIDFLNQHADLRTGKFSSTFTHKKANLLWEEITAILNSVPNGATKNWAKWRKTWQDLKKNAKAKNASIKRYSNQTGGGPPPKPMSDVDKEVVDMISPIQTDGLPVEETEIEFSFAEVCNSVGNEENIPYIDDSNVYNDDDETLNETIKDFCSENYPANDSANNEHAYSMQFINTNQPIKRFNKSSRLQNSIQLTQSHLKSVNHRNLLLEDYNRSKIINKNLMLRMQLRANRASWYKNMSMHH